LTGAPIFSSEGQTSGGGRIICQHGADICF